MNFLKAGVDSAGSQEDVVVSTGVGRGIGISDVDGQVEFADTGHIELVLSVLASPYGLLWCTRDRVYKDLLLVKVDQGVGKVLGRVATVNRGGGVDTSLRGLGASGSIRAVGRVTDGAWACTSYREATTTGQRSTVARLEDLFGAGR
jgi:hypothetical protein